MHVLLEESILEVCSRSPERGTCDGFGAQTPQMLTTYRQQAPRVGCVPRKSWLQMGFQDPPIAQAAS